MPAKDKSATKPDTKKDTPLTLGDPDVTDMAEIDVAFTVTVDIKGIPSLSGKFIGITAEQRAEFVAKMTEHIMRFGGYSNEFGRTLIKSVEQVEPG